MLAFVYLRWLVSRQRDTRHCSLFVLRRQAPGPLLCVLFAWFSGSATIATGRVLRRSGRPRWRNMEVFAAINLYTGKSGRSGQEILIRLRQTSVRRVRERVMRET